MTVSEEIELARKDGYKRVWLTNDYVVLCAELFLDENESWKNTQIAPYVIEEHADENVIGKSKHPYSSDTIMLSVIRRPDLQANACNRCIRDLSYKKHNPVLTR